MLLKQIRKEKKLTQNQLSVASGVSRITIARIETGATQPTINTLMQSALALNMSIADLIEDKTA